MLSEKHLSFIEKKIMNELKDFQKATVERIDYLYRNGQNRILVSDEVGLGKTLVARGTIAKFAKLRKEEGDNLVKVVYICSNATIAEQNLEKLKIVKNIGVENTATSRLSMQHLNIFMQENDENIINNYIQLIPMTPETSFRISSSQGTVVERALMYAILRRVPPLKKFSNELEEILRFNVGYWVEPKNEWEHKVRICDEQSKGKYLRYMINEILNYLDDIRDLQSLCMKVKKEGADPKDTRPLIVRFRMIFSDISLNKLDPDLIIMDEFQRFRYLLDSDENTEMKKLVKKFFDMDDMRILMLSATPYKMYSTLDEIVEDEITSHYVEFFSVMNFLNNTKEEQKEFESIWKNYSIELKEFNKDNFSFISAKNNAENALYDKICRTERITENQLDDIVDDSSVNNSLSVSKMDIISFKDVQKLIDDIGLNINVPVDYIKSTPYIMSFMHNYQLKKKIENHFKFHFNEINKMKKDTFWLNQKDIDNFQEIPYNNARLENLIGHVLKDNAEKLLWVPPSKPYYELGGVFRGTDNFSKTLVFSSWEMVPRMISSLVSYEIERRTFGKLNNNRNMHYFKKIGYPQDRLTFKINNDKPTQMYLFALLYPSLTLIDAYNPYYSLNRKLSLEEIEEEIKSKIRVELDKIPCIDTKNDDSRWYYLAPLLLDEMVDYELVEDWFYDIDQLIYEDSNQHKGFKKHFEKLEEEYFNYSNNLGKKPDDLLDVLCNMAIASPAICAYRLYEIELDYDDDLRQSYNKFSMKLARKFIDFMNLSESTAVIDLIYKSSSEDAYWKNILKYAKDGNFQAVLDEYVHLISSGLYSDNEEKINVINHKLLSSFNLRTTSYDFDTFNDFKTRIKTGKDSKKSLRTHFAVSFTKGKSDEKDTNRKKSVRDAFNSPFRPFVLASTSIGQEGLDFHNYCRRIVHWNLPSNPIDLEQREGRINRFECLAIRQNIAKRYGDITLKTKNVWDELFKKACESEKNYECSDLVPYWGLNASDDMVKIERIVPMYPFSRDIIKYDRLIKILSLYRLTLGQSRQEYLIDLLFRQDDFENDDLKELFINLSPYYKSEDKNFDKKYELTEEELKNNYFEEIPKINKIYIKSQQHNLPINLKFCNSTSSDNSNFHYYHNDSDIDLPNYWLKLTEKVKKLDFFEILVKRDSRGYIIPIQGIFMNLIHIEMSVENGFLKVMLFRENSEYGDQLFDYLFDKKDQIENELGFEVFWDKKGKSLSWRVSIFVPINLNNEKNIEDAINWHIFMAKEFDDVFSPRIRQYYAENPVTYSDKLRTKYWLKLTEKLPETSFMTIQMPHSYTWYTLIMDDLPYVNGRIDLHMYPNHNQVEISLLLEKDILDLYNYLYNKKRIIENEFGFNLYWQKRSGRCRIGVVKSIYIADTDNWSEAIDWQLDMAEKFKQVFSPKIKEFFDVC